MMYRKQLAKFHVWLFTDDSSLTLSHSGADTLQASVIEELNKIDFWMKINKLSVNYKKTECIVVTQKKLEPKFKLRIGDNIR